MVYLLRRKHRRLQCNGSGWSRRFVSETTLPVRPTHPPTHPRSRPVVDLAVLVVCGRAFENPPTVARARSRRFLLHDYERTVHEQTRRILHKSSRLSDSARNMGRISTQKFAHQTQIGRTGCTSPFQKALAYKFFRHIYPCHKHKNYNPISD